MYPITSSIPLFGSETQRAGIVPYQQDDRGTIWWLMGIKRYDGKLTDFGGGCRVRFRETPTNCALREMREELGTSLPELIEQIETNVDRAPIGVGVSGNIRRYLFQVPIGIPFNRIDDFQPTREILRLHWINSVQLREYFRRGRISPSVIESVRYLISS